MSVLSRCGYIALFTCPAAIERKLLVFVTLHSYDDSLPIFVKGLPFNHSSSSQYSGCKLKVFTFLSKDYWLHLWLSRHFRMMGCAALRRIRSPSDFHHHVSLQATVTYQRFGHTRLSPGVLYHNVTVRVRRYSSFLKVCFPVWNVLLEYLSKRLCAIAEKIFVRLMQHSQPAFYVHPVQQCFFRRFPPAIFINFSCYQTEVKCFHYDHRHETLLLLMMRSPTESSTPRLHWGFFH